MGDGKNKVNNLALVYHKTTYICSASFGSYVFDYSHKYRNYLFIS